MGVTPGERATLAALALAIVAAAAHNAGAAALVALLAVIDFRAHSARRSS